MMRLILALLVVAVPLARAATSADSSYRLRPEDVIDITVLGQAQLDKTVTILPDGSITYPRLGSIQAGGKTVAELREILYKGLDRFYNNLDVTVSVKALRTDHVTVRGAVKSPGIYEMHRDWTVRELLAAAGDLTTVNGPPAPDQMQATLIRKNGTRLPLSMAQLLAIKGAPELPPLEPDDVLLVEDLSIEVWVDGQVVKPGPVSLPPGSTVLDALRKAGGETEKAALTRAQIRRVGQLIPVNLRPFVSGKSGSGVPPVLQRFDTLSIPENKDKFLILGGVQRPGPQLIPEDETLYLADALSLAGGNVPHAKLKEVSLIQKLDGKPVHTTVNMEEIVKNGDLKGNVAIHPGDMIYVPDPKQPKNFNPFSILQGAALLFGL
jgi:polysaccharide export outer membrane protein